MFTPEHLERYARTLLWGLDKARKEPFAKGDIVLVRYDLDALPLAGVLWRLMLDRGLRPVHRLNVTPGMELDFFERSDDDQLVFIPPGDKELFENLNGLVSLIAPASLTHLAGVDPKRIGAAVVARKFLRDILEKREEAGQFSWTLCACPTAAQAECAGISVEAYRDQIVKACLLDLPDPGAEWDRIWREAQAVKDWLNGLRVESFQVRSEHCDLTVTPGAHRRWLGISGHNIPSFELFLSPDWRGTKGVYYADQPSYRSGNYVRGVRLEFREGRAVKATAEEGQEFVRKQLEMDEGACRLGEFSLTDRRFSRIDTFMANTLFDENYGGEFGNCHVAVGASYSDTYAGLPDELTREIKDELGFNDSALHWDLVNTEDKEVTARLVGGGTVVIYKGGEFQVP